ncbi:hypothetical protein ACHQM5_020338 [Ranunculus cassubicifolius]
MAQEIPQLSTDLQNGESIQNGNTKVVTFSCIKVPLRIQAPKAAEAIQFYKSAFGAVEVNLENHSKRKANQELPLILAADLQLGSSVFTISETDDSAAPVSFTLSLVTDDVDGAVANAVKAGGNLEGQIAENEGVGRVGKVKDPYGYVWAITSEAKK